MVVTDRPGGLIGEPYVGVGLSYVGYEFLGVPEDARPPDAAFRAGMSARQLDDPAANMWEGGLQPGAHGRVIGSATEVQTGLNRLHPGAGTPHGVTVLSEGGRDPNAPKATALSISAASMDAASRCLFKTTQQETDTSGTRVWDGATLDDVRTRSGAPRQPGQLFRLP
jgi:hypothetical protein